MPATLTPTAQVEAPASAAKIARPGAIYGLRLRAILVGLPLVLGLTLVSVYADMVAKNIQFGVLQLAPPAVAALFALALANRFLSKLFKREFLSRADILIIYSMLLVTVMVATRGAIERIIPPLAYLPYYATPENKLYEQITQHIPAWALAVFASTIRAARLHGRFLRRRAGAVDEMGGAANGVVWTLRLRGFSFCVHGDAAAPSVDGQRTNSLSADDTPACHYSR